MLHYHLIGTTDLKMITDYLLTFVGEITVEKQGAVTNIKYVDSPWVAQIQVDTTKIIVSLAEDDNISLNLIRNITYRHNVRVYDPNHQAFLVNDPNVLLATTVPLLSRYKLSPIFQYRNTSIFYARDEIGKIHITNRHLVDYLLKKPIPKEYPTELSTIVAENIAEFVALFDRGLISPSYFNHNKIVNHNGVDIKNLPQAFDIEFIYFILDIPNQSFTQSHADNLRFKKGVNLLKYLQIDFLAMKIGQDVDYSFQNKVLLPKLHISIFQKK